jgi:chaperonin GroEL
VSGPDEVRRVATLCANGDEEIGSLVASALDEVGREGVVSVVEGRSVETKTEVVRGLQLERGYCSPYFITDLERVECQLEDVWVLACEKPVRGLQPLVPILELVHQSGKPLLVIAEDITDEALTTLILNKVKGNLPCCAVKSPSLEHLRDVATVTGATIVSTESGLTLERLQLEHLGRAERVVCQPDITTFIRGRGSDEAVRNRLALLRKELERIRQNKRTPQHEISELGKRVRRLSQGVAIITIGGRTESELRERKDRVEDAVGATRLAIEKGVVPGGGVALLRCQSALDRFYAEGGQQNAGIKVLRDALEEPLRRIAENAGLDGPVVVGTVRAQSGPFGFDAARREYTDLTEAGIFDATKVVQSAIECAVNVTGLMLTTRAMLADKYPRPVSYTPYRPDLFDDEDDDY